MAVEKSNVIRLYDVKPELALEHLKRSTGLDFDSLPPNLADAIEQSQRDSEQPPLLTDIVELA